MGSSTSKRGLAIDESLREGHTISVSLLTGGGDKPYVFGLASALIAQGMAFDLIGSDELDFPKISKHPKVNFLNLRGDQRPNVSVLRKVVRVAAYYRKLFRYAAVAEPKILHIL